MDIPARYKHVNAMFTEAKRLREEADAMFDEAMSQLQHIQAHCRHEFIIPPAGTEVPRCVHCGALDRG